MRFAQPVARGWQMSNPLHQLQALGKVARCLFCLARSIVGRAGAPAISLMLLAISDTLLAATCMFDEVLCITVAMSGLEKRAVTLAADFLQPVAERSGARASSSLNNHSVSRNNNSTRKNNYQDTSRLAAKHDDDASWPRPGARPGMASAVRAVYHGRAYQRAVERIDV